MQLVPPVNMYVMLPAPACHCVTHPWMPMPTRSSTLTPACWSLLFRGSGFIAQPYSQCEYVLEKYACWLKGAQAFSWL